jgi:hypothetical protein
LCEQSDKSKFEAHLGYAITFFAVKFWGFQGGFFKSPLGDKSKFEEIQENPAILLIFLRLCGKIHGEL